MSSTSSTTSSSTSSLFNLAGMNLTSGKGIDVSSIVSSLVSAARAPETQWQNQQTTISGQISDLKVLETSVNTLLSDVSSLASPAGLIASRSVTTSNSTLVSASAVAATAVGSHTVVVNNLATTSAYYTNEVSSSSSTLATGTFDLKIGSGSTNTITIGSSNNTLSGLASTINNMNIGVTASVVTDANGARLALVSQSSGSSGDITISNVASTDESSSDTALSFTKGVTGTNASLTVDGVPISSASNQVTGIVAGLTLNLNGADAKTTVNINVSPNTSTVESTISSFVTDYNTLINDVNTEYSYSSSSNSAGPLSGDSTLSMLQNMLLGAGSYTNSANTNIKSLADLGITMNQDGTLTLDSSTLDSAVTNHYSDVQTFMQGNGTATSGFAVGLKSQLQTLTDSTSGAFTVDISSLNSSLSNLQDQIDNFEEYITTQQSMWTDTYNKLNVTLIEYPIQMKTLQAELGNSDYANITT